MPTRPLFGAIIILGSAVLFASATLVAKWAGTEFGVSAAWITMSRFISGLLFVAPAVLRAPAALRPVSIRWVAARAIGNVGAVLLFFFGIQATTVSNANLLNMTYPVFVFLFAPFVTRERTPPVLIPVLAVTMVGVWNVILPEGAHLTTVVRGDVLALASGVVAGFAVSALRRARQHDASTTIIFYMMATGVVINAAALPFVAPPTSLAAALAALVAGAIGSLGQFAITIGFRHVSAATGSLLSTARIPLAAIAGVLIFSDPFGTRTLLGAALILASLLFVTLYQRAAK